MLMRVNVCSINAVSVTVINIVGFHFRSNLLPSLLDQDQDSQSHIKVTKIFVIVEVETNQPEKYKNKGNNHSEISKPEDFYKDLQSLTKTYTVHERFSFMNDPNLSFNNRCALLTSC